MAEEEVVYVSILCDTRLSLLRAEPRRSVVMISYSTTWRTYKPVDVWKSAGELQRIAGKLLEDIKHSCCWLKKKSLACCLFVMLDFLCFVRSSKDVFYYI